ncbi:MAG: HrcA family transcriptional regulator, partial [Oscillospiraceae bacterium]
MLKQKEVIAVELDNRKFQILTAIVDEYIKYGEPVGSKTLSQLIEIPVSPATVRNEMAALFEMGLLEQPHTSAGRVPSHLGYRIYVDNLMMNNNIQIDDKKEIDA